ncbi:MAG: acetylxylan esterase [Chloracidobacterium sp.]|nr:acetylxylan esterase [Chloracidobacterium sp.]
MEAVPSESGSYPGVPYPDYFRCLPDFLNRLAARAYQARNEQIAALTTPAAVRRRQRWARETFWNLVGGAPERTPLNVRTLGGFEREGYRVEKLLYESQPNVYVSANLYIPKSHRPPFPGVLFQMGHTQNGKAGATYQRCCQGLAQLGYLVLGFDPMGQGERLYYTKAQGGRPVGPTDEHTRAGRPMLLVGQSATRMQVWDAVRSLDVLSSHPQVDVKRIGATGQSGGGTTTMFLSAVDDRIAAAVVCSGITENFACARFIAPGSTDDAEQDFVNSGPLGFDRWDLLYPLAPKPLLVSVSDRDFFGTYSPNYISSGWDEFQKLRKVYSVLGHGDKLAWGGTPLPHALSYDTRLLVYNWFAKWLKGETDRILVEPPTKVESDSTLWVSPSGSMVQSFSSATPLSLTLAAVPKTKTPADLKTLLAAETPPRGLAARVFKQVPALTCRVEALEIPSVPSVRLPAWLFRPKTGMRIKSVLLLIEPAGRNNGWSEGGLYQQLAEDGHIVCVPDLRGVGDLTPEMGRGAAHHAASHAREQEWAWASLILGKPLVGQRVTDLLAVQEALRNHDGVKDHPLVVAARGEMTVPAQLAAALDHNFTALYLSGGLLSFRNIVETEYYTHPLANFVPGILRHTDLTELPGPRRTVLAGMVYAEGQTVPVDVVKTAYSKSATVEVVPEARWDAATLGSIAP